MMTLDLIDPHPLGPLQIREVDEAGAYHRRVIDPGADVSAEAPAIQAAAATHWTSERVAAWSAARAAAN